MTCTPSNGAWRQNKSVVALVVVGDMKSRGQTAGYPHSRLNAVRKQTCFWRLAKPKLGKVKRHSLIRFQGGLVGNLKFRKLDLVCYRRCLDR